MKVLVPVDGSEPAEEALTYALEQFPDAELLALFVIDPVEGASGWVPGSADDWLTSAKERADRVLADATERGESADVPIETDSAIGRPARTIVEYADDHDVEHIVIGSHGRAGITRVLLGSVAETVVRRSRVPVTVARSRE